MDARNAAGAVRRILNAPPVLHRPARVRPRLLRFRGATGGRRPGPREHAAAAAHTERPAGRHRAPRAVRRSGRLRPDGPPRDAAPGPPADEYLPLVLGDV